MEGNQMFLKRAGTMFIFSIMLLLLIPIVAPSPQEKQSDTLRWFLSPQKIGYFHRWWSVSK